MLNSVFKKLNFKDQQEIYVMNGPPAFAPALKEMKSVTRIRTALGTADEIEFILMFVTRQEEVDSFAKQVLPRLKDDAVLWFAYPKGSSKKYKCEFNRDTGWAALGKSGFEGVRMVAIDEDWSALRFRNARHIKTMTRSFAMSEEGKKRVASKNAKSRK